MAKKLTFFIWGGTIVALWWFAVACSTESNPWFALPAVASLMTLLIWGFIVEKHWDDK